MAHVKTRLRKGIEARLRDGVSEINTVCSVLRLSHQFQSHEFPIASVELSETASTVGGNTAANRPLTRTFDIRVTLGMQLEDADVEDDLEALPASHFSLCDLTIVVPPVGRAQIRRQDFSPSMLTDYYLP